MQLYRKVRQKNYKKRKVNWLYLYEFFSILIITGMVGVIKCTYGFNPSRWSSIKEIPPPYPTKSHKNFFNTTRLPLSSFG